MKNLYNSAVKILNQRGVDILRVCLGIIFLWFGALKLAGASPVETLLRNTYGFLSVEAFIKILGVWEVLIGLGFITKKFFRATLVLFLIQMGGTLSCFALNPEIFFSGGNPLLLTMEGEFVTKNIILISAGLAVAGRELKAKD